MEMKCKLCNHIASSVYHLGKHREAAHPEEYAADVARRAERKALRAQEAEPGEEDGDESEEPAVDPELQAIQACLDALEGEVLSDKQKARTLLYVGDRLGFNIAVTIEADVVAPPPFPP